MNREQAIRYFERRPDVGPPEWLAVYTENGKARATSSSSEEAVRELLAKHPGGQLMYGLVMLVSVDIADVT